MTGFGKFGRMLVNPSSIIAESMHLVLEGLDGIKLESQTVIPTAIEDCDTALSGIYKQLAESYKCDGDRHIVLNFGVW